MAKQLNFIFANLCDNDFGGILPEALHYVWENQEEELNEEQFKYFVVKYVLFKNSIRRIHHMFMDTEHAGLEEYLKGALDITFRLRQPTVDHDGGSAVLDTATGHVWSI